MAETVTPAVLTRDLHDRIPLTRAMGVTVAECGDRVVLRAPLGPNVNHRETAFGGSLSGAAVLAGWAWLHVRLRPLGPGVRLVIHEATARFDRPVDGDFEAVCDSPGGEAYDRFAEQLHRRGKGRIELESRIVCRGETAMRHTGRYVALLPSR